MHKNVHPVKHYKLPGRLYSEIHQSSVPRSPKVEESLDAITPAPLEQGLRFQPTDETSFLASLIEMISEFLTKEKVINTVHITSNVSAIVTNITVLAKMDRTLLKTSVVVSMLGIHIVSLAYTLLNMYGVRNITIDVVKSYALEVIERYISPVVYQAKSWVRRNSFIPTIINWLKPVLSVLFFVVGFFLPEGRMDEWCKTMNTRLTASDKVGNTISDLTNKVLEDVCGVDMYGSKLILDKRKQMAEEGVELSKTPTENFIRDTNKRRQLFSYTQRATECLAEKLPSNSLDKLVKALAPLNSVIHNNIKTLTDIIKTIEECTQLSTRPPTVGVLLTGPPGVGKSKFAKHTMQKIGEQLGLDQSIYSVSRSGDYFDPYGGEHFGIHDEFLYMRSDDPIIPTITKMISGDYYNMEGAAIHNKKQTCELKMISFTTNIDDPSKKLIQKINDNAIAALWDRIVRVEVSDPLVTTRHDAMGNLHRKPDFSHLDIKMTISTDPVTKPEQYVKVHPDEYIIYFTYRVACSIKNFCDENDAWDIYDKRTVESFLESTQETFEELNTRLLIAIGQKVIKTIVRDNANIKPDETKPAPGSKSAVRKNNSGRRFFVVRMEGKGAKGKTTTANHIANKLSGLLGMDKIQVYSDFRQLTLKPAVYIVDDILHDNNGDDYLQWINMTHPRSIIILVTNIKYPICRDWMLNKYIDVTQVSKSSGIARRLGITGRYKHGKDTDFLSDIDATYVRMEEFITVEGRTYDSCDLTDLVFRKYLKFVANSRTITIVNDLHSISDPDITISAKSMESFVTALKSKTALAAGFTKPSEDFSVKFKSFAMIRDFSNLSSPEEFKITSMNSITQFKENMRTLIEKLCIYKPDAKVVINIVDRGISMGYMNRCMYINEDNLDLSTVIRHNEGEIYVPKNGGLHVVLIKELAMLRATATPIGGVKGLSADELDMITRYIAKIPALQNQLEYYTYSYTLEKEEKSYLSQFMANNKKLVKCVTLLAGISGTVMMVYHLYQRWSTTKEVQVKKNTADDEDHARYHKIIDKYQRRFAQGEEREVIKRDLIHEYGEDQWREAEWTMRNMYSPDAPTLTAQKLAEEGDWKGLQTYWKLKPQDIPTVKKNMVTPDMITFQKSNEIETLATLLEINTCVLVNRYTGARNFALGVYGKFLVSVAHGVEEDMEAMDIATNSGIYEVTCVWLDRTRDVALFKLTKPSFAFRDIRHHFGSRDLFDKTSEGYFVRTITGNRTIAACKVRYTAKRTNPLLDGTPYFAPDTGIFTTLFSSIDTPMCVKEGDCGLPLVVRTDQGLRIIAIHNAITTSNMAFFTSVAIDDFDRLQEIKSNASVYHYHKPALEFETHEWYKKIMDSEKKPAKVPYHGLTVLGYSQEAHLHSFPKDSHRELLDAQTRADLKEPLPTKPSALKFKPEIMSPDKLVKDNRGVPHTLWTQSVKYTYEDPLYRQWDPKVKKITMDLIKQRFRRDYQPAKYMTLALNINGDGTTNNKPWDVTTSGGPLLKKLFNVHTKEDLFINKAEPGKRPFYVFADTPAAQHVRETYEMYCKALESGKPIAIWCKDNRKVELLPADKVHEGKVRLFNEIDFAVNLMLKKYFGTVLSEVLRTHVTGPYKIGMDVYTEATIYHRKMSTIDGNILSTDISGCDKTMPAEIIQGFCETMCQGYDEKLINALALSLTYTIHIMDGVIYLVDKGNESGSYVTTALNCYAMEVITIYPIVEKLMEEKINPTLNIVEEVLSAIYYGDDRSMKVDKRLNMTIEDLIRCGAYFNFKVTPAKVQSDHISFCSRVFVPDQNGVVYPKLKKTSVLSCLFWVKKKETKYIQANVNVALFEASLHEKEFFLRVVNIVNAILKEHPSVAPYVQIYDYETYRRVFREFVYSERDSPILLKTGETEESCEIEIVQNLEQLQITPNNYKTTIKIMDYVSRINSMAQTKGIQPKYEFQQKGRPECPVWCCTASFNGQEVTSEAPTKKMAQQKAAQQIVISNNDKSRTLILNMKVHSDLLINRAFFSGYTTILELASVNDNQLVVDLDPDVPLGKLREDLEDNNFTMADIRKVKKFVNGRLILKNQVVIEAMMIKKNNDQPVEPAVMNQAAMGAQRANLPSQTNPQPTAVMPAMTHSGDDIMGAVTTALPETLNPIGAPDMLAVGAITFDIKDLIYQQFLDCDSQLVVSDDAVEGSIIAQIPYGLHSQYINSYIKYYAKAHERFNGSIQFRFTVIGNPLFSGAIGIAWYPKKIKSTTLPISELMKYSYQAEGVTTPWNKVHVLHDARREHFYRLVEDDEEDYDNRPHLVVFLMMSLQNPLREGVQTRIRIASKLANSSEPNPFTFSNPDILSAAPDLSVPVPGLTTNQGSNVPSVFPHTLNVDSNVFTDGTMACPQVFDFGVPHRNLILNGPLNGARVTRRNGSVPEGSYYQFDSTEKYRLNSGNSQRFGYATLYNISNLPRQQYNMFMNALGAIPSPHKLTTAEDPATYTGTDPDAFRASLIKFINEFNLDYVQRKFGVVGLYYSFPGTDDEHRFGLFKIVTTHGVIILDIQIVLVAVGTDSDTTAPGYIDQWGVLPYNQIDVPLNIDTIAQSLPSDYRILRISDQPVSAVIANTLTNPTATDDPSISMYYKRIAGDLDITQCYQFEIQDPISFRTIATVRYLQEYGIFVVRGTDIYTYLPQKFSTLVLTAPTLVNRSNGFPVTDATYWLSRQASTYIETLRFMYAAEHPISVKRNSAIAGGMLAGLGAGLGQKSKNKHELALQGNQLAHEKDMQKSDQDYGLKYQKRNFAGQTALMGVNYKVQKSLSKQDYTQKHSLASQQQEFAKENQNRDLLLSGARAPISGATTAVSHA